MAFGYAALKGLSLFLRFLEFCAAAIVLAISLYYLVVLHNHELGIATYIRAVTGISGFAVLYTVFAMILVCCLGGKSFFAILAILFDLLFTGAFIYVIYAYRNGSSSCNGYVNTPLGSGDETSNVSNGKGGFTHLPSFHTACKMESAAFAVAIIAMICFFISMFLNVWLMKKHKKEKAFGPSPNNGYTAGSPKRKFWQRKPRTARDPEVAKIHPDALPSHTTPADVTRASYATESTAVGEQSAAGYQKYGNGPLVAGHTQMPAAQDYRPTSGTNF